jgi:hypothetical protein
VPAREVQAELLRQGASLRPDLGADVKERKKAAETATSTHAGHR